VDYERRISRSYNIYVGMSGRYLAKAVSSYDTDGAYSLWKFTLSQQLWDGVKINFTVDNIFNYKPKIYYWNSAPTAGTTWSVGVSIDTNKFFNC